ncbi:MAG: tetraacyldisaccharide 4'-kinase [Phycisphaeraceae bacterium]
MPLDPRQLRKILTGEDRRLRARLLRGLLAAAEPLYAAAIQLRNATFDLELRHPCDLGRTVVSVGNLTAGGTGKTPMVIFVVRRLRELGETPAVLLRGYGNDEVLELREALPVEVEPNPDRAEGALAVLSRKPEVSLFVLDDGFQRRQVERAVDLVLLDATDPFGLGHLLPRGFLREPAKNLARADAVIVTRCEQVSDERIAEIDAEVEQLMGRPPTAHAEAVWGSLLDHEGREVGFDRLAELRVAGVCAIGNPGPFEASLRAKAGEVVRFDALPDHHAYKTKRLRKRLSKLKDAGAEAVVTTRKDWVKWAPKLGEPPIPVLRPVLEVQLREGASSLDSAMGVV